MSETTHPMTFDEFKEVIAEILMVGVDKLTADDSFLNDLSVDSINWLEMALTLEQLRVGAQRRGLVGYPHRGRCLHMLPKRFRECGPGMMTSFLGARALKKRFTAPAQA